MRGFGDWATGAVDSARPPLRSPSFAKLRRRPSKEGGAQQPISVSSIEDGPSLPAGVHIAAFAKELRANANIKDRIYGITLTKYKKCFKGSDAVSWMVGSGHAQTREAAVRLGRMLVARRTIHHVLNLHDFRDKSNLFYRFFIDEMDADVCAPEEAAAIARQLRRAVTIRDREWRRRIYRSCFVGAEAVDVLLRQGRADSRAGAVALGLQLERAGFLQHVRGRHVFKDDMLFYIFRGDEDGPGVEAWSPLQSRGIQASWWVMPHCKANSIALTMRIAEDIVDSLARGSRGSAAASLAAVRSRVRREASITVRGWELASVTRDGRPVSLTRGAGSKSGGGEGGGNGSAVLGADDNCVRVFRKKMDGAFETTKTVGVVHGITGLELVRQILHFKQRRRWDRSLGSGRPLMAIDCGDCDEACASSGGIISCRSTQGNGFFGLGRWCERQKQVKARQSLQARLAKVSERHASATASASASSTATGGLDALREEGVSSESLTEETLEGVGMEKSLPQPTRPVSRRRSRSEVENARRASRASSPSLIALQCYFDDFGVLRNHQGAKLDPHALPQKKYKLLVAAVVEHIQRVMSLEFGMSPITIPDVKPEVERAGSPLDMTSPLFGAASAPSSDVPSFVLPARLIKEEEEEEAKVCPPGSGGGAAASQEDAVEEQREDAGALNDADADTRPPTPPGQYSSMGFASTRKGGAPPDVTIGEGGDSPHAGSDEFEPATPASSHPASRAAAAVEAAAKHTILHSRSGATTESVGDGDAATSAAPEATVPSGASAAGVVWLTKGWEEADALLVVVPGSGGSMPGVWSRTLCIEQGLQSGSMLPLFGCAKRAGIAVAVLDPNAHYSKEDGPMEHVVGAIDRLLWPKARAVKQRQLLMMAYGHGGQLVARLLSKYPDLLTLAPSPATALSEENSLGKEGARPPRIPTLRALGLIESSHKLVGSAGGSAAAKVFFGERTLNWRGGEALALQKTRRPQSPTDTKKPGEYFVCNSIAVGDADAEHRALSISTCTPAVFIFFEIALRRALIDVSDESTVAEGSALGDVLRLRESLPRLIERHSLAKSTLSWPQQHICLQDAFRWRSNLEPSVPSETEAMEGDADYDPYAENENDFSYAVYEFSVNHPQVEITRGHVRGEDLLTAFVVEPLPLLAASSGVAHPGVSERALSRCRLTILRQAVPERGGALSRLKGAATAATDESLVNFDHIQNMGTEWAQITGIPLDRSIERRRKGGSVIGEGSGETERGSQDMLSQRSKDKGVGVEDFELLSVIGRGGYGKVFMVRYTHSSEIFAMKVLKKADIVARQQVEHTNAERSIMEKVDHPFVVGLKCAFQTTHKLYMVMDFVQGGDMYTHLSRRGALRSSLVQLFTAEIVLALQHLHSHGIVYRDLKPENVLLDRHGHVKLTDFGLSRILNQIDSSSRGAPSEGKQEQEKMWEQSHSFCGTEIYMAPEMLLKRGHDSGVDWWCLGILISEMASGRHPFAGRTHLSTLENIVSRDFQPQLHPRLPSATRSLIGALLQRSPSRRLGNPRANKDGSCALRSHRFFATVNWDAVFAQGTLDNSRSPALLPSSAGGEIGADATAAATADAGAARETSETDVSAFDDAFTREAPLDSVMPDDESASTKGGLFSQILNSIFAGGSAAKTPSAGADAAGGAFDQFDYVSPALKSPRSAK